MDAYQATYDAVRSRIGNGDIGGAVETTIRDMNIGHYFQMAASALQEAAAEQQRPSALMRPSMSIDGNMWCALYGENLQDGVSGFGESPYLASVDFDKNWYAKLANTSVDELMREGFGK